MVSYNNPPVELVPNPEALDLAIQAIQERLAGLSWLEKAFGRCTKQIARLQDAEIKNRQARNEYTFPEVYFKREPYNCMVNDNLKSYCFFHAKDALRFTDWEPFLQMQGAEQPLALIFWLNLGRIDPAKNYNFSESLRREVVQVLKQCPGLKLESSSLEVNNVFNPFTITEAFRNYLKPPFAAFRFDGTLSFDYFNC